LAAVVAAVGCGGDDADAAAGSGTDTTATVVEDLVMEASDFVNINDMTPVRGYFIDNRLGYLDEAISVAEDPDGGTYPVGTIIQLVPSEAMVKRAPGFSPATNDWEFFSLAVSPEGTEILERGGAEVINQFGGSCADCHLQSDSQFDLVCENTHGCEPLPIGDEVIQTVQASDPRPSAGG
jgi:hypothetical protein